MAILKHIASKNADYGETERYLIFQHDEYTQKPILDENGNMLLREEYYLDGINCNPFTFDTECIELNAAYHKNQNYNEIKSHHYILSFDPNDKDEHGLTGEHAQQLGLEYAKKTLGLKELYSFTSLPNKRSERVMQKIGMVKSKEFDHPLVSLDHPLCRHVLYKISLINR